MDNYCRYDPEQWDISLNRTKALLKHVTKLLPKGTEKGKRKQSALTTTSNTTPLSTLARMSFPVIPKTKRKKLSRDNLEKHVVNHLQKMRKAVRLFDEHLEKLTYWLEDSDE